MATTTPDNILTPDAGDQYALVQDLGLMADSVQDALNRRGNALKGTSAQRAAALASTTAGVLWQDTDGIGMIWKRGASAWVPAVWRWAGSTAQMNAFTQAPNGFEWGNTTDSQNYRRVSGSWRSDGPYIFRATLTPMVSGGGQTSGWFYGANSTYTFPPGMFPTPPKVKLSPSGTGFLITQLQTPTAAGITYAVARLGAAPASDSRVELEAWLP